MKRIVILVGCMSIFFLNTQAQQATPLDKDGSTLQERYRLMKEKSETYSEYKVVRQYVLDGLWRMTMDSLRAERSSLGEAHAKIAELENELSSVDVTIKQKDASIEELQHEGSHIRVLGMDFQKSFFVSLVGFIFLGLMVFAGVLIARMKWMQVTTRQKTEMVNSLTSEFETYKRNALDKQMKLSRELQDERNKAQEMRSS